MANIKIAQLTNQINIVDTDLIIIESATSTNKMTVGKLKELLGIQAGGVVESGSNANGRYIKYNDGTMICYGEGVNIVTFPHVFLSEPPRVILTPIVSTQDFVIVANPSAIALNGFQTMSKYWTGSTFANFGENVAYMAIGRWK